MENTLISHARISVPSDCFELVSALVCRLGGQIIVDDDVVTIPPMSEKERVGKMLKGLRLREGLTQKAVAEAIGVPQSHVSEYEKNKRPVPAAKAAELAKLLHSVPENFLHNM